MAHPLPLAMGSHHGSGSRCLGSSPARSRCGRRNPHRPLPPPSARLQQPYRDAPTQGISTRQRVPSPQATGQARISRQAHRVRPPVRRRVRQGRRQTCTRQHTGEYGRRAWLSLVGKSQYQRVPISGWDSGPCTQADHTTCGQVLATCFSGWPCQPDILYSCKPDPANPPPLLLTQLRSPARCVLQSCLASYGRTPR